MDFSKVLTRSWEIIWKFKALWIFGILASCGGNFSANFGGRFNYQVGPDEGRFLPPELERFFTNLERNFNQFFNERNIGWIIVIVCIAILIGLLFWALGIFGKVGLIKGVVNAESGAKSIGFRSLAGESWALLGKALGLSLLLFLIPFFAFLILGIIALALGAATMGIALICLIPLFCLLVPVFLLYFVYTEMAFIALIKDGLTVGQALSRGWEVFRSHLGNLVGMGLILFVGGILVSIIIGIPVVAIMAPAIFGMLSRESGAFGNGLLITGILFLIALPFLILVSGIIRAYIQSAWTLTYMQLTGAKPKTVRARARA